MMITELWGERKMSEMIKIISFCMLKYCTLRNKGHCVVFYMTISRHSLVVWGMKHKHEDSREGMHQ